MVVEAGDDNILPSDELSLEVLALLEDIIKSKLCPATRVSCLVQIGKTCPLTLMMFAPCILGKVMADGCFSKECSPAVYITSEPSSGAPNPIGFSQNQSSEYAVSFQILKGMTNNFCTDRKLGEGSSGVVYKGVLKNQEIIAVKKFVPSWMPGSQEQFQNEVYHLMMLKHPNIVRFRGYCYETRNEVKLCNGKRVFAEVAERLLCLEYLPKGSLDKYLSDESSGLDWSTRYNIIEGICYGLCHLHEQIDKKIIHLDLKPANILLDDRMVPKITDFGLSRLLDQQQTLHTESRHGTFGYMPPEIFHRGTVTSKSDIFSLGVIIMEVITGRRDYPDVTRESPDDYIELALTKWRVVLQRSTCDESLETYCKQIKRCIQVGLMCVNPDRTKRPPIMQVIDMLQGLKVIDCNIIDNATQQY
ncbi:putative receptor-like protein kinase At4g00960 [Triticum dicoccoides]|uniref:putative receptor-like protein kinase At4g00960 n=1 Tax=Triticum dicoccoides TaxID=85692 RepID=UPI00188E0D6B|nr:putative receptor-like protein kinase At4g00960 [Triticum dicoccoides]